MSRETEFAGIGLPALTLPQLKRRDGSIDRGGGGVVNMLKPPTQVPKDSPPPPMNITLLGLLSLATAIYAFRVLHKASFLGELQVSGNTSLANTMFVDFASSSVGIGASASSERLLVDGTARFTGNVTIGSTVFITGPPAAPPAGFVGDLKRKNDIIRGSLSILGDVTIIGLLTAERASFENIDATDYYSIRGVRVLDSTSLGEGILYSNLKQVGTLDYLDVTNNFTVGIADFVVNTDTGKVGINTNDPMETLDVVGTLGVSEKIITDFIEAENGTLALGCGEETEVINIGVSTTHPKVVNIGSNNGLVNIHGSVFSSQATNLEVTDKNITLNDGGLIGSAGNAGLEVSEGGSITAFFKVHSDRDRWVIKAPGNEEATVVTSKGPQFINNGLDLYYNNGNVGIGTSGPRSKLEVFGDIRLGEDDRILFNEEVTLTNDTLGGKVVNSSLENVGVLKKLEVEGTIKTLSGYLVNSSEVLNETTLGETVLNSSLERVGNLIDLEVIGDIQAKAGIYNTGMVPGNGIPLAVDQHGKIVKVASSMRYKTNVKLLSEVRSSEDILSKLQPKVFEYKNVPGETVFGLIAEEVEAVDRTLVTYDQEGVVDGIQYLQLIPLLIEEIKKIPKLTKELNELKEKYKQLEK